MGKFKNSLYIVWKDEYNTGVPIIDEQHRGIISNINSLHYFIQHGISQEALQPVLVTLQQYTIVHFKTEENLMQEAGYQGFGEHRVLHEELASKTIEISQEALTNNEPGLALSFLRNWWLNHIIREDFKCASLIKDRLFSKIQ